MLRLRVVVTLAAAAAASWALSPCEAMAAKPLTLAEAIGRALQFAPAIEAAAAQSQFGRAHVEEARAPLFPWLSLSGEYYQPTGYSTAISNGGLTQAQLLAAYQVFDGGRRSAQLRAARYAAQAAALGVRAAQAQIEFDTTVAYFALLRERATETELGVSIGRLGTYVKIVQALLHSGRVTANDVLMVQVMYDSAELRLAAARQAAAQASVLLASMLGDFGDANLEVAEVPGLPVLPAGDPAQNPALQAATRQVAAAKLAVDAARAERSPTVNVTLTSGWQGINPPVTFGRHLGASYDGAVSVPIFQGGLLASHVDQALASEHLAFAQQRQLELQLKRDFADAALRYRSALDQLGILRRSQQSANDSFALDWTRFLGGGNVTLLEVTTAYQQAENIRIARFDQEFNARQAVAQARLVLGLR